MSVRLFYIDESYDAKRFCLSAVSVRYSDWHESFKLVQAHRRALKQQHGVYIRKEIHARELVSGRGNIASQLIGKYHRAGIFRGLLELVSRLPHVWVFNVCLDVNAQEDAQIKAWDRLLNRIERTMLEADKQWIGIFKPRAMIFADEGKEGQITRAFRKRSVFNPIPSRYGAWAGVKTKNIPLQRIIEDPIFKKSHQSFLVQLADCVAFALLKRETPLAASSSKYGVPDLFENSLGPVCFKAASPADKFGIVRG